MNRGSVVLGFKQLWGGEDVEVEMGASAKPRVQVISGTRRLEETPC
jgi:hypothetical protein